MQAAALHWNPQTPVRFGNKPDQPKPGNISRPADDQEASAKPKRSRLHRLLATLGAMTMLSGLGLAVHDSVEANIKYDGNYDIFVKKMSPQDRAQRKAMNHGMLVAGGGLGLLLTGLAGRKKKNRGSEEIPENK